MFDFLKSMFRRHRAEDAALSAPQMNYAIDATRVDDNWGYPFDFALTGHVISQADLVKLWRRSRQLYYNAPAVRKCVENMVSFVGCLQPAPATDDAEWNELASAAWHARTGNPDLFSLDGRRSYQQFVSAVERSAIIDGDVGILFSRAADQGAAFGVCRAPRIMGGGDCGIEFDGCGRAIGYYLAADDYSEPAFVPARAFALYSHNLEPELPRGISELVAGLCGAKDMQDLVTFAKRGVKLSNSMGLVMTSEPRSGGEPAPRIGGRQVASPDGTPISVLGTGMQVTPLPPGRKVEPIADNRPSTQVQEFWRYLTDAIAMAAGLDERSVFASENIGSAATRFLLEKTARWIASRHADQRPLVNRMYEYVISCEIAAGRLRPCRAAAWKNVRWIAPRDMTIDTARVASAQINLVREGLADANDFTLRTQQKTVAEIARQRASDLARVKLYAAENGIDPSELMPGSVGAQTSGTPTPQPIPDDEPEQAGNNNEHNNNDEEES